ncbi:pyridoxal-phosphate dependent enzyme [Streptomyces zhihengii]
MSLGEGCTPMVRTAWGSQHVHFKLEWFNPTSSFKDRGVSVMMSHLAAHGADRVLEDSSGNAGASVAAYAAAAGVRARIIVPAATSAAKILQARAYGAEIELVGGTRDEVADEAVRQSKEIPYASHNWHPCSSRAPRPSPTRCGSPRLHRARQRGPRGGAGSNVIGCDLAFGELLEPV